jgi:hypothetical protein
MWLFPLAAALIAAALAGVLVRRAARTRHPADATWAIALAMYAAASFAMFLGVRSGWTPFEYRLYWLLGAALTVPYLAQGEIYLLAPRWAANVLFLALLFGTAFAVARIRTAVVMTAHLSDQLPLGRDVFGAGTAAHRLPQLYSIPAYGALLGGALWSAWRVRGRRELRGRFTGTLLIAGGATVVAVGSGIGAAFGMVALFSASLAAGVALMMAGVVRASRSPAGMGRHRPRAAVNG